MGQQGIAHNVLTAGGGAGIVSGANQNVCVLGLTSETGTVIIQIDGGWAGTVQFEGSANLPDGSQFYALSVTPIGGGAAVTSATANGCWSVSIVGLLQVRVRCSSYSSGSIAVTIRPSNVAP